MNAIAHATHIVISYEITTSAGDFTPARIVLGVLEKRKASEIINELCAKESTTRLTADFVRSANVNFKHHNAEHIFCWVTYDKYLTEARVQSVVNNRTEGETVEEKPNARSFIKRRSPISAANAILSMYRAPIGQHTVGVKNFGHVTMATINMLIANWMYGQTRPDFNIWDGKATPTEIVWNERAVFMDNRAAAERMQMPPAAEHLAWEHYNTVYKHGGNPVKWMYKAIVDMDEETLSDVIAEDFNGII